MMRVVFPILACVVLTLGHSSIGFAQICEGTQDFTPGARLRLEATAARFGHATDGHILSLGLSGGARCLMTT
jgi:hypothetical protein